MESANDTTTESSQTRLYSLRKYRTKAIQSVDAKAKVEADTKTKTVRIDTQQEEAEIKGAIARAGYPAA